MAHDTFHQLYSVLCTHFVDDRPQKNRKNKRKNRRGGSGAGEPRAENARDRDPTPTNLPNGDSKPPSSSASAPDKAPAPKSTAAPYQVGMMIHLWLDDCETMVNPRGVCLKCEGLLDKLIELFIIWCPYLQPPAKAQVPTNGVTEETPKEQRKQKNRNRKGPSAENITNGHSNGVEMTK